MPVPKVSIKTTPLRPLPAPKRISARPAASASFTIVKEQPVDFPKSSAAGAPIHFFETLAAVRTTPESTIPGNPQPTGPFQSKCRAISTTTEATDLGVEGLGVGMR